MEEYKTYINEKDLHYKLMDFINPETKYGLDKQVKNTIGANSEDFKRGAMWGAAVFLLFANSTCDKVYIKNSNENEDENENNKKEQEVNYVLAQRYIGLKELIFSVIDSEKKRKAFDKILKNTQDKEKEKDAFIYHQAICELGYKIIQIFEENK